MYDSTGECSASVQAGGTIRETETEVLVASIGGGMQVGWAGQVVGWAGLSGGLALNTPRAMRLAMA